MNYFVVLSLALCLVQAQLPNFTFSECETAISQVLSFEYENAILLFDSSGKSFDDLGKYDNCLALDNADYCMLHFSNLGMEEMGLRYFRLGICVPKACNETELSKSIEKYSDKNSSFWTSIGQMGLSVDFILNAFGGFYKQK